MPTYTITETVDATPETLWPVLADVARWPDWSPTVTSVEPLDGEALAVGRRFRVRQPKLRPAVWVVASLQPPHGFTWEARSLGTRMVADHLLHARGSHGTTLELRFAFGGWIGTVLGLLAGGVTRDYLVSEASSLKARADAADGPSHGAI